MKRCSKCDLEKPENEYYSYYHSVQQKWRQRKVCNSCIRDQKRKYDERLKEKKIIQPEVPESLTIDYSTNPDYYKCYRCHEWKVIKTDYYLRKDGKPLNSRCKVCQRDLDRIEADQLRKENGGNLKVNQRPNHYLDSYQRENTFLLMELMGYTFDEETGIWFKEGWKHIVDGKPVFIVIKEKMKNRKRKVKPRVNNVELINKIIEMRSKNMTYVQIADKLNVSDTTVRKYYMDYGPNSDH